MNILWFYISCTLTYYLYCEKLIRVLLIFDHLFEFNNRIFNYFQWTNSNFWKVYAFYIFILNKIVILNKDLKLFVCYLLSNVCILHVKMKIFLKHDVLIVTLTLVLLQGLMKDFIQIGDSPQLLQFS